MSHKGGLLTGKILSPGLEACTQRRVSQGGTIGGYTRGCPPRR
jgi:hypothetical protein